MKFKQEFNVWSLDEVNKLVNQSFSKNYWHFIILQMNYPEIQMEATSGQISCPAFIPFRDLALEVMQDLRKRNHVIKACQVCTHYFDINKEDGIFGDTQKLDRFICLTCANKMSAKEYFERYLVM